MYNTGRYTFVVLITTWAGLSGLSLVVIGVATCCCAGSQQQQQQQIVMDNSDDSEPARVCPDCGMENPRNAVHCGDCGFGFKNQNNNGESNNE
jgi:ribosomal protein S27AE